MAGTASEDVSRLQSPLLAITALLALSAADAGAETIASARYSAPVERYGHFALGRPHEYARLTATTDGGRLHTLELPDDQVFEDLHPRLLSLAAAEPPEILVIVSQRDRGSRLALIRLRDGRLEIGAQAPAIGTPMRWLNPVGAADLDGDGQAEIAAVSTPHIGGELKVHRRRGDRLIEVAALSGFSNHVYGSSELELSTPIARAGRMQLLVPDASRRQLRIIALHDDRLLETGHCPLPAALTGAITLVSPSTLSVELLSGRQLISLNECLASR